MRRADVQGTALRVQGARQVSAEPGDTVQGSRRVLFISSATEWNKECSMTIGERRVSPPLAMCPIVRCVASGSPQTSLFVG